MKRSLAIAAALALGAVVGDLERQHPVARLGHLAKALERHLWRDSRPRGALYTALLVGGAYATVSGAERRLFRRARLAFGSLALWTTLGRRSLAHHALALGRAVESGDLAGARLIAPTLVGRDPAQLDGPELCRAAVESVAENTTDAVVAPIWRFAIPGAGRRRRLSRREHLKQLTNVAGAQVYPSVTNFVLVRLPRDDVPERLRQVGVAVRPATALAASAAHTSASQRGAQLTTHKLRSSLPR